MSDYATATWGAGNLVLVDVRTREVVDSSSPTAKAEAEKVLAYPELSVWEDGDKRVRYAQGDRGFVAAALTRLPRALVTWRK